jgi:hypothetical protein
MTRASSEWSRLCIVACCCVRLPPAAASAALVVSLWVLLSHCRSVDEGHDVTEGAARVVEFGMAMMRAAMPVGAQHRC